ncbi:MAG: hypothetical protein ACXWJK_12855, partial [Burkholderiaceae bacterium]
KALMAQEADKKKAMRDRDFQKMLEDRKSKQRVGMTPRPPMKKGDSQLKPLDLAQDHKLIQERARIAEREKNKLSPSLINKRQQVEVQAKARAPEAKSKAQSQVTEKDRLRVQKTVQAAKMPVPPPPAKTAAPAMRR